MCGVTGFFVQCDPTQGSVAPTWPARAATVVRSTPSGGSRMRVTVGSFPNRAEAQVVAHMLADAGLDPVVTGDDAGGQMPHLTIGSPGPSVSVPADQRNEAVALLDVDLRDGGEPAVDPVLTRQDARRRRRLQLAAVLALAVIAVGIAISVTVV